MTMLPLSPFATVLGTTIFTVAVLHTFCVPFFNKLALRGGTHAGFWHLLAEVEAVFGFWALLFLTLLTVFSGPSAAGTYLEFLSFSEPAFVFSIMVVASSKPVLALATRIILGLASRLPFSMGKATFLTVMTLGPLFGSLITEPAAMTLTALILYMMFFTHPISKSLKYAIIGTLFVNVSIGGGTHPLRCPAGSHERPPNGAGGLPTCFATSGGRPPWLWLATPRPSPCFFPDSFPH